MFASNPPNYENFVLDMRANLPEVDVYMCPIVQPGPPPNNVTNSVFPPSQNMETDQAIIPLHMETNSEIPPPQNQVTKPEIPPPQNLKTIQVIRPQNLGTNPVITITTDSSTETSINIKFSSKRLAITKYKHLSIGIK